MWQMQRVGDFKELQYIIVCANNCCVKDGVNHVGYMLTLVQDPELKRTDTSYYLVIVKFDINNKSQQLPVWRLLPVCC
jgi:hypothetical protein